VVVVDGGGSDHVVDVILLLIVECIVASLALSIDSEFRSHSLTSLFMHFNSQKFIGRQGKSLAHGLELSRSWIGSYDGT